MAEKVTLDEENAIGDMYNEHNNNWVPIYRPLVNVKGAVGEIYRGRNQDSGVHRIRRICCSIMKW